MNRTIIRHQQDIFPTQISLELFELQNKNHIPVIIRNPEMIEFSVENGKLFISVYGKREYVRSTKLNAIKSWYYDGNGNIQVSGIIS